MKTKFFIIFVVLLVLFIGGLGVFMNKDKWSSKLIPFAQALKDSGAQFYGAFWCPHCQEQKAEFGSAKNYLPYIECSTVNNTQTEVCKDAKIEGYPSWKFKDGITIKSEKEPKVCEIRNDKTPDGDICKNIASEYYKTWIFPDYDFSVKSPIEPVKDGTSWKFPPEAQASGKLPLSFLAEQINFNLPQ